MGVKSPTGTPKYFTEAVALIASMVATPLTTIASGVLGDDVQ